VFISAAEPSGDRHAATLIEAVRRLAPGARFVGVAGPRMRAAGCESIFDMTGHASMLLGAVTNVGRGIAMIRACDECLRRYPFDAAVVVDSPTLHLPLAGRANAAGIQVLYYIAPQMWAWGKYRIYKLRHRTTKVACILPFEEEFFRNQGVDAVFVGHPLAEQLRVRAVDARALPRVQSRGEPVVAILPGSRRHVVQSVLPGQLQVAERIAAVMPRAFFAISAANPQVQPAIASQMAQTPIRAEVFADDLGEILPAADLVLVASGTAALEVAFYSRPMIVMYNASRLFYHAIGRWLIDTPFLSLPNILAGREIVPEFMPYYTDTGPIAARAIDLLNSEEDRRAMSRELEAAVAPLRNGSASSRTAEILLQMVHERSH
jgi:lipid-A-disaccharide synthase